MNIVHFIINVKTLKEVSNMLDEEMEYVKEFLDKYSYIIKED